jgi:UDP-N-acetylglucosamine acyltransferase
MIHKTAIVKTKSIGENVSIGAYSYINSNVILGNGCKVFGFASIGSPPQWRGHNESEGFIIIGENVEIREFVTINAPNKSKTVIRNNCFLLAKTHIGHDAFVDEAVTLGVGTVVTGFSGVGYGSYFGQNSVIHQFYQFPAYSMLGANSFFKSDITVPGLIWVGCPAEPVKVNKIGLERNVEDLMKRERLIENASEFLSNYSSRRGKEK